MKKLLFISTILFSLIPTLFSQAPYYKMLGDTNRWYVSGHGVGVKTSSAQNTTSIDEPCIGYYEAIQDSLYNGLVYKKFIYTGFGFCFSFTGNPFYSALVREDTLTKQVFVIPENDNIESLVMDFNLNLNDQIFLSFGPNSGAPLFDDYYNVDSIVSLPEILGFRKHFYLSSNFASIDPVTNKKYYVEWVESIGAKHFPISQSKVNAYLNNGINYACPKIQFSNFVTCKFTNNIKYYQDSCALSYAQTHSSQGYVYFGNACEFYSFVGGTINLSFLNQLELFPNPSTSTDQLTLKFKALIFKPFEIIIYNTLGQKVYSDKVNITTTDNEIKLTDLKLMQGLYTLQFKSDDESSTINFIRN